MKCSSLPVGQRGFRLAGGESNHRTPGTAGRRHTSFIFINGPKNQTLVVFTPCSKYAGTCVVYKPTNGRTKRGHGGRSRLSYWTWRSCVLDVNMAAPSQRSA